MAVACIWAAPAPREDVERFLDAAGTASASAKAGGYVIADVHTDRFVGTLRLDRRAGGRPRHVTRGRELELPYVMRRAVWGAGLTSEAALAALRTAIGELPDQPVLIVTQFTNGRSRKLARSPGLPRTQPVRGIRRRQIFPVEPLGSFRASLLVSASNLCRKSAQPTAKVGGACSPTTVPNRPATGHSHNCA